MVAIGRDGRPLFDLHGGGRGFESLSAHSLFLVARVPVPTVAGRLGHANTATTPNVDSHFVEASDREAANVSWAKSSTPPATARRDRAPGGGRLSGGTLEPVTIGEELLEERRRRRRAGDPRITPEGRELLLRMTTGDLMDEFQAALDADLAADPILGGHETDDDA
jgi:hypothetical protein